MFCPNINNKEVVEQFNQIVQQLGGQPLSIEEFKSSELRGQRTGTNYAAMEAAYRIWDSNDGEIIDAQSAIQDFVSPQKSTSEKIEEINKRVPNTTAQEHLTSQKISNLLSELFPEISVEYVESLANGNIGEIDLQSLKVLVDYVNGRRDTLPHEYAHYYYNMFKDSDIMKEGLKLFGSEEKLVQAIGERVVEMDGEQRKWYTKLLDWIKSFFSSELRKRALLGAITDAFLENRDLGNKTNELFGIRNQPVNMTVQEAQLALSKMANGLVFDSASHVYHSRDTNIELTSVSERKKQYGYSTYDDSLEDMDQKKLSNDARARGTLIHSIFEDAFTGNFNVNRYSGISRDAAIKINLFVNQLLNDYDFVASEAMLYDEQVATAGTADLIMRDKKTGEYIVLDFKTKLVKHNGKNTKQNGKKFSGFLYANSKKYSPKSSEESYDFQLSLYQKMMQKIGINVTKRGIIPLVYETNDVDGIINIGASTIFGSAENEQGEFENKPINDKKHGIQWIQQSSTVKRDINAKMYQDYSDFATPEDGKRFVKAMDDALEILAKIRNKLDAQTQINSLRGRSAAAYRSSVQLNKLNNMAEIDAMLSYIQYSSDQLKRMVDVLQDLYKQGDQASWSLSKLHQYYQVATSYDIISELLSFVNANEDLFNKSDMQKIVKNCAILQQQIAVIKGAYTSKGRELYLNTISSGISAYRARILERKEDEYTKKYPMKDGETGKQFRARRKQFVDEWAAANEEYLKKEENRWLKAQTEIADSCFEANAVGQYFSSVYESADPFVQAMVRAYDNGMLEVNHKFISMRSKLDKLLKAYYKQYGYGNLSDMRKVFDDFVDITEDGKCYLVSSISSEYRNALDLFMYDLNNKQTLTADQRRQAIREWHNENNPIVDQEAYSEEFKTQVTAFAQQSIKNQKDREKYIKIIFDNFDKGVKTSWQKLMYAKVNPLPSDIVDFLVNLDVTLDIKYRKPNPKYNNSKYEKMMSLSKDDSKRKLWELLSEISSNEGNSYNLPTALRLNGRLPSVIKSKYEEAVTHSVYSAAKLGIQDAFTIMEDEQGVARGVFVNENGNRVYQVPMPYTGKYLTEERQSFNLPDIFLRYYDAANTYKVKQQLEELVIYTQSVLSSRSTYTDKQSNSNTQQMANEVQYHTKNLFDAWVKQVFYSERTADMGTIGLPNMERKIDVGSFLKAISRFSSTKVMSLNMVSAINNILTGDVHSLEEAFAGKYIDLKTFGKAHKIFMSEINTMIADAYRVTPESKLNKICQWLHIFDGTENVTIRGVMSNGLGDYGHALSTLGERWIQGKFVIAYLLKMEAKDANGNVLGSMYDFIDFDENNQLKITDSRVANFNPNIQNSISLKMREILMGLHGNYDGKNAAVAVESNAIGWFGLSLRRWIQNFIARRVGRETYNDTLETRNNGMYRTFGRYIGLDLFPRLASYVGVQIEGTERNKVTSRRFGELKDWERENIVRTVTELAVATLAFLIFMCIGSGDDDDDSVVVNMLKYQAYRLYTDLTFLNPISFIKIFRDPFPATRVIQDVHNVLLQFTNPTEVYNNDTHMIDNKLLDKLVNLIPGSGQIHRFQNIQNEMTYFIKGR